MAKGWDGVEQTAQALAEQREQFAQGFKPEIRVGQRNPGPFQIRFLEQGPDVSNFKVHEYKVPGNNGQTYNKRFTCLAEINQACPGCQAGMKQKIRGVFNVIQRNRPVYQKGQDGKAIKDGQGNYITIGYEDTVVIANVGSLTAEMLRKTDGQVGGLMSRDFVVQYSGETFQSWHLSPALDGAGNSLAVPLSEADLALAASKHDLDEYMKPPSQQEAAQIIARYGQNSGASPNASPPQATSVQGNPTAAGAGNGFLAGAAVPGGAPVGGFGAAQQAAAPAPAAPPAPAPAVTVPAAAAPAMEPGTGQSVVPQANPDGSVTQGAPTPPVPPAPPAPAPTQ